MLVFTPASSGALFSPGALCKTLNRLAWTPLAVAMTCYAKALGREWGNAGAVAELPMAIWQQQQFRDAACTQQSSANSKASCNLACFTFPVAIDTLCVQLGIGRNAAWGGLTNA